MKKRNIIIHFLYFLVLLVIIVTFAACKSILTHESASAYIDDSVITAEAKRGTKGGCLELSDQN